MFFVRWLLLFAALYFSPVHADDFTKRLSQDHHSKIDHDTPSLGNPSRLATLAAIHKKQQLKNLNNPNNKPVVVKA